MLLLISCSALDATAPADNVTKWDYTLSLLTRFLGVLATSCSAEFAPYAAECLRAVVTSAWAARGQADHCNPW